jgi:hypothetical protein
MIAKVWSTWWLARCTERRGVDGVGAQQQFCPFWQEAASIYFYCCRKKSDNRERVEKWSKICPVLMEELLEMSILERPGIKRTRVTAFCGSILRIGSVESIDNGSRARMIKALADRGVWVA